MFLTKPQKCIVGLLQQCEAIREEQIKQMISRKFAEIRVDQQLRQLVYGGLIRWENGFIRKPEGIVNPVFVDAIDVMLLIEPNDIPMFQTGTYPFALTFFKTREEKLLRYDVCPVKAGMETVIAVELEGINPKYRVVVFVLERPEQRNALAVSYDHCFAWKQDGTYHFYKPERKI